MVLYTESVSHRNTFVGGTCASPSALLVIVIFYLLLQLLYLTAIRPLGYKDANKLKKSKTQVVPT